MRLPMNYVGEQSDARSKRGHIAFHGTVKLCITHPYACDAPIAMWIVSNSYKDSLYLFR